MKKNKNKHKKTKKRISVQSSKEFQCVTRDASYYNEPILRRTLLLAGFDRWLSQYAGTTAASLHCPANSSQELELLALICWQQGKIYA